MASNFVPHPSSRFGSQFDRVDHFRRGRGDHFQHGRFGFWNRWSYGYPYYGYPYYGYYAGIDPYWWWNTYSSYDEDAARDRALAAQMNAENLEEQQSLREQAEDRYARSTSRQRESQSRADERAANDPPTVLVYRDRHQREIQNYAIVGQMLWSFTPQRTEKIPIAQLDIPATTKANEDRGVDFRLPRSSEGQ